MALQNKHLEHKIPNRNLSLMQVAIKNCLVFACDR